MNRHRYRTIFSKRLGTLVAVAETAKAQGKGSGSVPGSGARVSHQPGASRFIGRRGAVSTAVAFALWGHAAFASPPLPTGGEITSGTGTISQSSNTLTVNQSSQSLAANWQSFDIDAHHAVVFNQPNSSSIALNRVIGPDASAIYGSLSANGKVFLVNPNGVLFAPGAQVSVGGLVASTLKISDEDFAAGRYRFTEGSGAGSVVNEGSIDAGSVALIGPKVVNNGTVQTQGGRTTFAAGDQVTVSLLDGLLTAQVDAAVAGAEIQNHGQIIANGGQVHLLAGRADTVLDTLINTDGVIQANSIRSENGKIYLDGGAGGTVYVSGALDASASNGGDGGEVRVLGDRVTLGVDARVDVSGSRDGGTALIGGDFQGKNPDVANANVTTVAAGASIRADGAERGGRVIVWADDTTRFAGEISALGKGFAEVSGKGALSFSGSVDTGGGTLFLDPPNITVQNTPGDLLNTFSGSQIATLLASNDLILNADIDITWNANATLDYNGIGSTGRTLTLQAGNNIAFNGDIVDGVAGGDSLNVLLNSDWDANGIGGINVATFASIVTSGGDITLRGGIAAFDPLPSLFDPNYSTALGATAARNISLGTATLNAGGGNITMRGIGVGSNSAGVFINGTTIQTSGAGTITLDGIGGSGVSYNPGVGTLGAANISTVDGALTVQGIGGGTGIENAGVRHNGGIYQTTGSGNLIINSLGSTSSDYNDGMVVDGAILRVNNGNLIATGIGRGTGVGSDGIELANAAMVEATGTGNVTLDGTSIATGSNTNRGVTVWINSTARTASGALTLQGASPNAAFGNAISVDANGTVGGVGQSGSITLTGDSMNFASGAIRGSGSLLLQPLTPAASIGLGNGAAGTLNLTAAEIGLLQNGFSSITIGRGDSSGAVDVRTAAFLDPLTIRTPAGSGDIAVNGALSTGAGTSSGDITLLAADAISLAAGTINTTNALNLTGASYSVTGSSALTSNTLTFGNLNSISNTGTLTLNQTSDTTISNEIEGASGNLTKAGTNTLTLTGANSYTGTTTISAGTLQVGAGGTAGTLGTGAIANNGALTFNRSDTTTYSGVISGSGSLTQAGSGTLVLSGDNTYGGTTTISAGTLQIGDGGATGTLGSGAVVDNGALVFNRAGAITAANAISGTGSVGKEGTGTVTLTGVNSYAGGTTVNAGTLAGRGGGGNNTTITPFGSGSIAVAADATAVVDNTTGSGYNNFNNEFTGTGTVSYLGSGVNRLISPATLSGFTGTVSIDQNVVQLFGANTTSTLNVSGGATFAVWSAFANPTFGALTGNGTVSGVPFAGAGGTLTIGNGGASGTFAGVISDASGQMSLVKAGGGTQVLTGTNTYTGPTTINAGTLQIAGSGSLASGSYAGSIINDGVLQYSSSANQSLSGVISGSGSLVKDTSAVSTLTLAGNNTFAGSTTINAGTLQVGNGGTTGTLGTGNVVDNGTLTFNRSDALTVSNVISGSGDVVKAGTGTTSLAGTNTYAGATAVTAGTLAVTNAAGLGDTTGGTAIAAGAALDLQNVAVGAESVTLGGGALRTSTGTSSLSGAVSLASASDIDVGAGAELTLSGVISGGGGLTKAGSGTLVLTAANTYTGLTTVNIGAGTLAVANDSALGSTSAGTTLRLGGTLELRNVTLAEAITPNAGAIRVSTGASTLSGNVGPFSSMPVDVLDGAQLTMSGVISGATSLIKNGGGTLTLTGNNTSNGATTITAGTVRVGDGGTTGTLTHGAVTVASGANLVFDRSDSVSLSTLANNVAGITGAGNVTALIGGDFNVDRPIALSGASSSILLEAGKDVPAGTVAGGNVTLNSNVSTSTSGTIAIFSGNATTAAYEAMVSGADGATRYKTYGASASDTAGAIAGTRNYYYRQQPSALSVSGLTATRVYDGLLDATAALDSTGAVVNGAIDGDILAVTLLGAQFDSAHAGPRTLNAVFSGPAPTYSSGGTTWSTSGYSSANVMGSGTGTITPRSISTSIDPIGRAYNGLTSTTSTLSAPTGFIGNDRATSVVGMLLAFDNPNAGTRNVVASGTGTLTGFSGVASGNGSGMTPGNEVAGLATDYTVAAPSAASAVITPAALIVTANDDAKIITQGDAAGYNGVSFSGFVNGESVANLSGTHSITRSNAGTEAAGQYGGVLVPTGYSSSNYTISYVNGGYQILPAQQLLIHIQNLSSAYGTAASYAVTGAEYLDGSGASLLTLTQTAHSGNTYTFSDGLGGSATFTVAPNGAVISNAGYLSVGNYELSGINTSIGGINFAALNYVGNHTVTPIGLTPLSVARVYDGTTSMTGARLGFAGLLGSDQVLGQATGAFHSRNAGNNVGYDISNITLSGADAGNYYLTTGALSGTDGLITPRPLTITAIGDIKTFDGSTDAAGIPIVTGTLASGDSFTLLGQEYATAGVGFGLTLTPFVGIDDGNGGANYALTLVNNNAGAIRSSIDLSQVGGTQISARLNDDSASSENGTSADAASGACTRGRNRNGCDEGETSGAMIEVRSTGIRLPSGLAARESSNQERPSW